MFKSAIKDENGAVVVFVALMLTILFGITALAVDVGRVYARKASMQSAVDAAALAAVHELPDDTAAAETKADDYFENNGFSFQYYEDNYGLEKEDIITKEILNSNKKIRVSASLPLDYTFAKIFNMGDSGTITKKAAAVVITAPDDLDYAIFSGSSVEWLQFTGNSTVVVGDVHANEDIKGKAEIDGSVSAVGNIITLTEDDVTGTMGSHSSYLEMPKLSSAELLELKNLAIANGTYFSTNKSFSADDLNNLFESTGDTVIYVEGNVSTNGHGVNINQNTGTIVATGDITFNGSDVTLTQDSPICFYSLHGDITLNGGGATLYGAVWAPEGEAAFDGTGSQLVGKLYGDTVKIAGGVSVTYRTDDFIEFPIKEYKLVE